MTRSQDSEPCPGCERCEQLSAAIDAERAARRTLEEAAERADVAHRLDTAAGWRAARGWRLAHPEDTAGTPTPTGGGRSA